MKPWHMMKEGSGRIHFQAAGEENDILIIRMIPVRGDLGHFDAEWLMSEISDAAAGFTDVILDLSHLQAIGDGIGTVTNLAKMVHEKDGRLVLADAGEEIVELFRLLRFTEFFHFEETVDSGVRQLSDPGFTTKPSSGDKPPPPLKLQYTSSARLMMTLKAMDGFLERLPQKAIQDFARSAMLEAYKNVFDELHLEYLDIDGYEPEKRLTLSSEIQMSLKELLPFMDRLLDKLDSEDTEEFRSSPLSRDWRTIVDRYS